MSSAAKAKGAGAERDVIKYLKEWFPYVDRRLAGAILDKGDVSGIPGVTIEIKNHAKMNLAGWVEEQDKIPLLLALSLYNVPKESLGTFTLIPNSFKERYAAWFDESTGVCIIGCI